MTIAPFLGPIMEIKIYQDTINVVKGQVRIAYLFSSQAINVGVKTKTVHSIFLL